jgi:hypothetical protein
MNRTTRLSVITVMLLATTALGIMGWNAMHPKQEEPKKEEPAPISMPVPAKPKPNPEYERLKAELEQHDKRCLQLAKQATILLGSQNQNQGRGQAEQRLTECRNLADIERKYVENFPAKTIQ